MHQNTAKPNQERTSPTQMTQTTSGHGKLPTSAEGMIKGFEQRFIKIYERVKELRNKKTDLSVSNEELIKANETELQTHEETLAQLRKEISRIMIKNNEMLLATQKNRELHGPSPHEQLSQRNKQISDLADQMKTVIESLKRETARTETLEKQIMYLKKENIDIDNYLAKSQKADALLEEKNLSNFPKYKNLLSKGADNQKQGRSPTHELDALLNISPKSGKKTKDVENLENLLRDTAEINVQLRQENEKLKKNIMSNMHSDYEKPVYAVQNTDRDLVEHAKKQQKLKISKLFADEDKLISHISHHSRDGVITHSEDEYIKKKDAQNEENFRRILEIKELERLQDQIQQQDTYIDELERNAEERENLLMEQKRELNSMEDNIKNFELDIKKNQVEKDILDTKYRESQINLEEMKAKYDESLKVLPEDVRLRLKEPMGKESGRGSHERASHSHVTHGLGRPTNVDNDDDLEALLKKTPKALDLRKN